MIIFCDEALNIMSFPVEDFTSFTWEECWTEPGAWNIALNPREFEALKDAAYIYYDAVGWGVVESIEYTRDSFKMGGRELSAILDNYVISSPYKATGRLETACRTLITTYSNIGLGEDNGFDTAVSTAIDRGSLMTRLYEVLTPRGMSFKISVDTENHAFVFDILRGSNRTSVQGLDRIAPVKRQSSEIYVVLGQTEAAASRQGTHLTKGSYVFYVKSNVAIKLGRRRKSDNETSFLTTTYAKDIAYEFTLDRDDWFAFWVTRAAEYGGVLVDDIVSFSLVPKGNPWAILSDSKGNIADSKYTRNSRDYKNYVVINVGDDENPLVLEYDFRDVL